MIFVRNSQWRFGSYIYGIQLCNKKSIWYAYRRLRNSISNSYLIHTWNCSLKVSYAQAKFVMISKNKGSSNDPSKYRCIGLLNHAYKVLSLIMLMRLLHCSESSLCIDDWQAGFRAARGCRDNTFILRTLCQQVMALGERLALTFVDYSAAFDTVSHKFLTKPLRCSGSAKGPCYV